MYRPLPKSCTIRPSSIEGLGLFATEFIPADTDLGMTHVFDDRFADGVIRLPLGGFFNHSENPNCKIVEVTAKNMGFTNRDIKYLKLVTIQDVQPNEELTAYYTLYQPKA